MRLIKKYGHVEINASSMADIAFLLLTFFLMTTVINIEKGISLRLPPWNNDVNKQNILQRNLFTIQINSSDQFMVEGERRSDLSGLKDEIKTFILNYGSNKSLSENPEKAIVSLKADRGTTHKVFTKALDEIQSAYYEIYAQRVGITAAAFRELDINVSKEKILFDKGRAGIPMNISIAEPASNAY